MRRRTILVVSALTTLLAATGSVAGPVGAAPNGEHTPDGDDLNASREAETGADPHDLDTDADGLRDGVEVHHYGTDPLSVDSDGDGYYDSEEVLRGTGPNDPNSHPATSPSAGTEADAVSETPAVTDASGTMASSTSNGSTVAIIGGLATTLVSAVVLRRLL